MRAVTAGDESGAALVYHPGTPHGATPERVMVEAASARGLRLVSIARPGYPGSTPRPGRTIADIAADTAEVMNALGHSDFLTLGWSGGGPHALACAALLSGCRAACVVAGIGPYGVEDLDFLAGMAPENVEEFAAAIDGEDPLSDLLRSEATTLGTVTGADVVAAMGGLLPPPDQDVLTGALADEMADSLREALADGITGWRDDDLAFVRPWGFDLAAIRIPVSIWQGTEDTMVPAAHGAWLGTSVPTARMHRVAGEGHLSVALGRLDEILAGLVELGR